MMQSIIIALCISLILNFAFLNLATASSWVTYYTSKSQIFKYDEASVVIKNQTVSYKSLGWYSAIQSPDVFVEMQTINCSTLEKQGTKNREEMLPLPATVDEYARVKLCMQVWDRASSKTSSNSAAGFYEGEKRGEVPHGFGYYKDNKGYSYLGFWDNGKPQGTGIAKYQDLSFYYGKWEKGQRQGFGTYYYKNLSGTYKGEWSRDARNGSGVYRYSDGRHYDGTWVDNKKHGLGTLKWPEGDFYKGEFFEDKMNGKGVYYFADGRVTSGTWNDDLFIKPD